MERVNCENDNHLVSGKTGLEQGERELPFSRDAEKLKSKRHFTLNVKTCRLLAVT